MSHEHLTSQEREARDQYARAFPDLAEAIDRAGEQLVAGGQAVDRHDWTEAEQKVAGARSTVRDLLEHLDALSPPPEPSDILAAHQKLIAGLRREVDGIEQMQESVRLEDLTGYASAGQLYDQGLMAVTEARDRLLDLLAPYR